MRLEEQTAVTRTVLIPVLVAGLLATAFAFFLLQV